ncbi:MAG: ChaN family lipoprotein [Ramlibacter sp.]
MRPVFPLIALLLGACAAPWPAEAVDALLLGEQHDAESHPRLHQQHVAGLARRGALGAVALEMAEAGASTAGLPPGASEEQVRQALRWNTQAWPWERYGPAVMEAVAAGVPVLGANLPRERMRAAMADATLDDLLPGPALQAQQQAIRLGHCGLLPESQIRPMTRIQVARDREMARTIQQSLAAGKTVVLLAGAGHVAPDLGVPLHLPATVRVRPLVLPPQETGKDYCGEMRQQMRRGPSP